MDIKEITDSELIAAYRRGAAERRANSRLNSFVSTVAGGVVSQGGVVTVKKVPDAKTVSALGGTTKVFGSSRIWIPEYKQPHG